MSIKSTIKSNQVHPIKTKWLEDPKNIKILKLHMICINQVINSRIQGWSKLYRIIDPN